MTFAEKITKGHWPSDWFLEARTGDNPWIFYMSDPFIQHVLTTIEQVLETLGLFVRDGLAGMEKPWGMASIDRTRIPSSRAPRYIC
jgi:hypothetical protein